jgi:hypothetical protein
MYSSTVTIAHKSHSRPLDPKSQGRARQLSVFPDARRDRVGLITNSRQKAAANGRRQRWRTEDEMVPIEDHQRHAHAGSHAQFEALAAFRRCPG